jgi:SAM-dependent methyltransferase
VNDKPQISDYPYFASYYRWLVASQRLGVDLTGPRILDVGCDDANFLGRGAASLRVGVDMAPRVRPQNGIEIVRADARQLPIAAGGFDSIMCFDVLEHIEEDRAVMREMLAALSPHGTIWISTPALGYRMFPKILTPYTNRIFGHVRNGYTAADLQALIPDPERWMLDCFYWNEPLLRLGFVPIHVINQVAPALAARVTQLVYALDRLLPNGKNGHLFATIRRRAA